MADAADLRTISPGISIPLIFRATVSEMIRRRIVVFLILICCVPILLSLVWRTFGQDFMEASGFFTNLVSTLYLQLLVYVVGLAFGIPTVHSEIEGRTITYLFTRPVPKWHIYAGKLAAVQLVAGGLLAASLGVCFLIVVVGNSGVLSAEFIKAYMNHVVLVLVATICITAVCAVFGTAFSRPVTWGMMYAFGWELIVSKFPGKLATYTINFHVRNLFLDDEDLGATLMDFVRDLLTTDVQVTPNQSGFALLVFLVGATALGAYLFRRKEYVIS